MSNSSWDLRQALTNADNELLQGNRPLDPPVMQVARLERRAQRKRQVRRLVVGVPLLLVAFIWSWNYNRPPSPSQNANNANAVNFARATADLQRDVVAARRAARVWQRERQQAALRSEYHALRHRALVQEIDSPVERAARMNLKLARALERQLGTADSVLAEYRRIVLKFPQTHTARLAAQRLAQLRAPTT